MKKLLAFVLCFVMVVAVAATAVSADEKLIDARELGDFGQLHFWLEPVEPTEKPDVTDGKVSEGEYFTSYEYGPTSDPLVAAIQVGKTGNYTDTEWVKLHLSSDGESVFLAMEVTDKAYYPGEDHFMICFGARDAGRTVDSVSRIRYDFGGDPTNGVLVNENVKISKGMFDKNDDGSWGTAQEFDFDEHVGERSVSWDAATNTFTLEAEFKIQPMLDYWSNTQEIEDARLYFFPAVNMFGDSAEGKADGPISQGYLNFYFNAESDPAIKLGFLLDYPDISYWFNWEPHIIHLTKEPDPTTAPPTTTTEATTAPPTTTKVTTTAPATTTVATTVAGGDATTAAATTAAESSGCGSTVALSALALIPMLGAAVVFGKKKEN